MKDTLKLINKFEKKHNICISLNIHGDGSGSIQEFISEDFFFSFENTEKLNHFLENGKLLIIDGFCVSPIEIIEP
jgi:hypothetical protein